MEFFTSGLFWFLEGVLACLVLVGLRAWAADRGIPMPIWKWVLFVIWAMLAGFTIAFVTTSLGENETEAAIKGGILFGLLTIITGVGVRRLLYVGAR